MYIIYLVKELQAAYTQQWEEQVTNNAQQQKSLKEHDMKHEEDHQLCSHHVIA